MTSYAASESPTPLAVLVNEQRVGSAGSQAAIGIAGIVLALVLVLGQISLATTKGMAVHLEQSVANLTAGNATMASVVERAAPTVMMEQALASQSSTLANTRAAMAKTNTELDAIAGSMNELGTVVGGMQTTSGSMASNVSTLSDSTGKMTDLLGSLPASTTRTHKQLSMINTDTNAINAELAAIGRKMLSYGLPHAKGAPVG